MRILITNDDGITAPGLEVLVEIAHAVAGPDGEVWTVAPATEQSGVGHCISYLHPARLYQTDDRAWAVEGYPADCVLVGIHHVLRDTKPDLVLSGVNRGNNSGENVLYSGTIGAAMEAALQGVKAIALSQFYGPGNVGLDDTFEAARAHGADTVKRLLENAPWGGGDYGLFYNVNFPPVAAGEVQGMKSVRQGFRKNASFGAEVQSSPTGRDYAWIRGGIQQDHTGSDTDVGANMDGFISVTPLRADLTSHADLADLEAALR